MSRHRTLLLVIVIFHCANPTAFHMSDWKFFRKGDVGLNWDAKWVAA